MMKPPRAPPNRRRSSTRLFVFIAPLILILYLSTRSKPSSTYSVPIQTQSTSSTRTTSKPRQQHIDDDTTSSTHSNTRHSNADTYTAALGVNQVTPSPPPSTATSTTASSHHVARVQDLELDGDPNKDLEMKEGDYSEEDLEAVLNDNGQFDTNGGGGSGGIDGNGDGGDEEEEDTAGEEAWDEAFDGGDDEGELGDDDEDPTEGAAFSGEGLDDGDEDEEEGDEGSTSGSSFSVVEVHRTPPPNPSSLADMVFGRMQDESVKEVLAWMSKCTTLTCIIKAHDRLQGRTRFNFPHFFLVGWQKCATTSVNAYLRFHPQYLPGLKKEPHWFSVCQNNLNAPHCLVRNESQYLREFLRLEDAVASRLELVTLDASADYAGKGGPLARRLYRLFPWLKVVIMVREPISRLISYTRMHTQSTFQQWKACKAGSSLFTCLRPHLTPGAANSNYSDALLGWLTTFPTDQIHVIQFEELQETPEKVLYDLKAFLGMDVDLPDRTITNVNSRREGGYPMGRGQYLRLVRMVKADAERTADMLHRYGLADKNAWMSRWHAVWNGFLQRCPTFEEQCLIDSN